MSAGIYTQGSIWANAISRAEQGDKWTAADSKQDAHLYVLGSKGSGKSTLLSRFLYPGKVDAALSSQGLLEYTFARKASAYDHEHKDLAHIWEIAGSKAFAEQIAYGNQLFLTYRQVTTAVVLIVLDLSDPGSVISSALHWLELVKHKLGTTYSLFECKKLQLPEQLRARQAARLFSKHEDKDLVSCTGVSLVLAMTKWDVFRDAVEPEQQKVLAHCLRWLAHANAAHLVYIGGLQPGGAAAGTAAALSAKAKPQQQLDVFCRLLNHLLFAGMDRNVPLKLTPQFDHLGAVVVPAGADRFRDIGAPQQQLPASLCAADVRAVQEHWLAMAAQLLPGARQQEQRPQRPQQEERYNEEDVDNARLRREAALEAYRREVEAIRRSEAAARKGTSDTKGAGSTAGGRRLASGNAGGDKKQQQQQVVGGPAAVAKQSASGRTGRQ